MLTGEAKNRWLPILLGIGSPLWLYMGFTWLLKYSLFNAVCLFSVGILAAIIAIQSLASSNKTAKAWLVTAWGSIYTVYTWPRAIHESQKDHAGSLILLGTLGLILLIVSVYLVRWCFLKLKTRVGVDD